MLLLGDAAGFAEAFYGEGIYFALRSAQLAAEASLGGDAEAVETACARLIRKHLAPDFFYSELNARLFYPAQRFGYYRMVQNQPCSRYFGEMISGSVSYAECFFKTAATMPYWLFSSRIPPSTHAPF